MNDSQWLIEFDASKAKFQWFFLQYGFDAEWKRLEEARSKNQVKRMKKIMEDVWYELPEEVNVDESLEIFVQLIEEE